MCTGQRRFNKASLGICKSSKITVFISVFSYKFWSKLQYCQHILFSPFTMHVYPVNSATFNNPVCFVPYIIKHLSLKFPMKTLCSSFYGTIPLKILLPVCSQQLCFQISYYSFILTSTEVVKFCRLDSFIKSTREFSLQILRY